MKFEQLPTENRVHRGRPLRTENAVIESATLSIADHGMLLGWLRLRLADGGGGFGGYTLGFRGKSNVDSKGLAAEYIVRCLEIAGVQDWDRLSGKTIRVLNEGPGGDIVAIGHIIKDDWFCPRVEWEKL